MHAKPIAQKKLQGTYRKDRAAGAIDERFENLKRIPKPPEELNDLAVEVWYAVGKQLVDAGIFKSVDIISFAMFCAEVSKWREAEQHIKDEGLTYIPPRGRLVKENPWVRISRAALDNARRFFGEFGLTPAERTKIKIVDTPDDESLADKLFNLTQEKIEQESNKE